MDPLTVQYTSFTQRRLHYSFLFWACLALHFSGLLIAVLFSFDQTAIAKPILLDCARCSGGSARQTHKENQQP